MHIDKINITNFKCFGEKTFSLSFNEGLNIIVGNNEAGKSTILEAINLALSGWFKKQHIYNELTQDLFNTTTVNKYLESLKTDSKFPPPEIIIEIFLSNDSDQRFRGNKNSLKADAIGFTFKICFDEDYKDEYQCLIDDSENLNSLPIEFYKFYWESFSYDQNITPRKIPVKSLIIDSTSSSYNSSDIYINNILKECLETTDLITISQAHRKLREDFSQNELIQKINNNITNSSTPNQRQINIGIELATKNAWEKTLVTLVDQIPFNYIGEGEKSIIKTQLALTKPKAQKANVLLIEEPENHLSHTSLNRLINIIKENNPNKQIIITTHSSFVANKLGLSNLILLNHNKSTTFNDLSSDTFTFFQKLSGYDTLRFILANRVILVEGDSDELIVQKAYLMTYNKLPIEDGIDVISVGNSFKRFIEIAEKINLKTTIVTDIDYSKELFEQKFENYIGKNKKENIVISYDQNYIEDNTLNGIKFNQNTLEPILLRANNLESLNKIFGTSYETDSDLLIYMHRNKTQCALDLFSTDHTFEIPAYIKNAITNE